MTTDMTGLHPYAEQLSRLARALTTAKDEIKTLSLNEAAAEQMKLFAEENLAKRCEKLRQQLDFLADAFDDLDELLKAYSRERPLIPGDNLMGDGEKFLRWVEHAVPLAPEQHDYVVCQRARHAVEIKARQDRRGHVRFQELWSVAGELAKDLTINPDLCVQVNPIHAWTRFTTPVLLGEEIAPPTDVLFFAVRSDIRTAVLENFGQGLVRELAARGPCTLSGWAALSEHAGLEEVVPLCRELAELGLVAFS